MGGWHLYLIRCNDNSLYAGIAKNVAKRFAQHQSGGATSAKYLRGRLPLTLTFACYIGSKSAALKAEYRVKKLPKWQKELLASGKRSLDELGII